MQNYCRLLQHCESYQKQTATVLASAVRVFPASSVHRRWSTARRWQLTSSWESSCGLVFRHTMYHSLASSGAPFLHGHVTASQAWVPLHSSKCTIPHS